MTETSVAVPCGKCPKCKARRISHWSFRLRQENKRAMTAHFITLTYDTNNVPISDKGFMQICKRDIQLFFKRLRKAHEAYDADRTGNSPMSHPPGDRKIKYYCAGEYGGKTLRPHYHIILFNAQLELIQPAWEKGQVHYGTVSAASIGYCLKYISKEKQIPKHQNDDRQPEFSLMSKGLGENYVTEKTIAWHKADKFNRFYCPIEDNKKISMPRYIKDRIYSEHERKGIGAQVRIKMEKELEKAEAKLTDKDKRNRVQDDAASFRAYNYKANQNQKL